MTPESPAADEHWIWPVVREHEAALVLYASRILGDVERARDVVQDTFCRLCGERREEVEPFLRRWLFTVCRNRALDVMRKEQRMTPLEDEQVMETRAADPPPLEALQREEEATGVLSMLGTLPANQQEVLRLKFQNGLSYREIGDVLSISASNVGFLIHRGLRTLRAKLAEGLTS